MIFTCLHCKQEFERKWRAKFCSQSCAASHNNKGVRRHGNPPGTCKLCGKPKADAGRTFCSITCNAISQTKYIGDVRSNHIKNKNKIAQHKWRSKHHRKLDETANPELVSYIIKNCPDGWEIDHIIPLSKGGTHHENNLQYLPALENRNKGNRLIYSAINREFNVRDIILRYLSGRG